MRVRLGIALALALAGCAQSHRPAGTAFCPTLQVGDTTYFGVAGSSTDYVPFTCVEAWVDGQRRAHGHVTGARTYALRFFTTGPTAAHEVEIRFEALAGFEGTPPPYRVTLRPELTQAILGYEPDAPPVVAGPRGGAGTFTGWLEPGVVDASPPASVWLVNWTTGDVGIVDPTPAFDEPFTAEVHARTGDEVSPLSRHSVLGAFRPGGCWWPRSRDCRARCVEERLPPTETCDLPTGPVCSEPRGCMVIEAHERGPRPPPESADDGVRSRADAGVDAGPGYDAGPEAGVM